MKKRYVKRYRKRRTTRKLYRRRYKKIRKSHDVLNTKFVYSTNVNTNASGVSHFAVNWFGEEATPSAAGDINLYIIEEFKAAKKCFRFYKIMGCSIKYEPTLVNSVNDPVNLTIAGAGMKAMWSSNFADEVDETVAIGAAAKVVDYKETSAN